MLGAIIGDLAATTWRTDNKVFYESLVAPNASLSNWGEFALEKAQKLAQGQNPVLESNSAPYPEWSKKSLILMGLAGWMKDSTEEALAYAQTLHPAGEKEDFYAKNIIVRLIVSLRNGRTKNQAFNDMSELFYEALKNWDKKKDGAMGVIARAWDAFYRWYDFTSVIHSAVKSPIEPNLTAIIAGLFAEAMYGCRKRLVKLKYSDYPEHHIKLPEDLDVHGIRQWDDDHKLFYPKNDGMGNVELYHWKPSVNPYKDQSFDKSLCQKIRMAFEPSWEARFGIYLDNGRFYVYRSGRILYRFLITRHNGQYRITDVEQSGDPFNDEYPYGALTNAMYSVERPPYQECPPPTLRPFDCCALYRGDAHNPYEPRTKEGRIWHGEKMFYNSHWDLEEQSEVARKLRSTLKGEQAKAVSHLSDKEFGLRLLIEQLYLKWCPMEKDFSWVYRVYKREGDRW
ncbi:MAG: hypothetical protein LUC85_03210 [Bacteroidales bacterium]|nr:hypothetical protein [Bacteroidales bacterium]